MSQLDNILDGLIQQTTEGKLAWTPTVADDRYVTSIDTISVVISQLGGGARLGIMSGRYQLEILNDQGFTVEVLQTSDGFGVNQDDKYATDKQAGQMSRLYALARRSALNAEATLEKLARALES